MAEDHPESEQQHDVADVDVLQAGYPVSYRIFAMARAHRAIAAAKLAEIGLFPNQEIMLIQLGVGDGVSQKSLRQILRVGHVTVAKTVARMERAGLVERRTSETDRRVSLVYLTDAGRSLRADILALWADLEAITTTGLSAADQASFVALADKIRPALDTVLGPSDPPS